MTLSWVLFDCYWFASFFFLRRRISVNTMRSEETPQGTRGEDQGEVNNLWVPFVCLYPWFECSLAIIFMTWRSSPLEAATPMASTSIFHFNLHAVVFRSQFSFRNKQESNGWTINIWTLIPTQLTSAHEALTGTKAKMKLALILQRQFLTQNISAHDSLSTINNCRRLFRTR